MLFAICRFIIYAVRTSIYLFYFAESFVIIYYLCTAIILHYHQHYCIRAVFTYSNSRFAIKNV